LVRVERDDHDGVDAGRFKQLHLLFRTGEE